MFCPNCGTALGDLPSKFCPNCGSATLQLPAVPEQPTEPVSWTCATCGRTQRPAARFCGDCGAAGPAVAAEMTAQATPPSSMELAAPAPVPATTQPIPVVPLSPPVPTGMIAAPPTATVPPAPPAQPPAVATGALPALPPAGGGQTQKPQYVWIALGAVACLVIVGVVAYLLLGRSSNTAASGGGQSVSQQATTILQPVSGDSHALITSLGDAKATPASLQAIRQNASALVASTNSAQTQAAGLIASSNSDRQTIASLRRTLAAEAALAHYLQHIPISVAKVTNSYTSGISPLIAGVNSANATMRSADHQAPNLALASAPVNRLHVVVAAGIQQAAMRSFLGKMENFFSQSASGRSEVVNAIGQTQADCAISPDTASQELSQVASNRQSLLDQVSALTVPQSADARQITNLFQQALQASIQADNDYSDWMSYLFQYYYTPPVGCLGNAPPTDQNHSNAVAADNTATNAKSQLASLFDRVARSYGMKADWTSSDI